jgi:hypothetical protein
MPDHLEMKWMQLFWRFHQPQGGIPFHHFPHAMGDIHELVPHALSWKNRMVLREG